MLYVAMSGAKETLHAQAAVNNNMANANTPGFLADLQQFRSMPVFGAGHPTRVYAMSERPESDRSPGTLDHTGRDLDVAIKEGGWPCRRLTVARPTRAAGTCRSIRTAG
jgi:flagellar basal-body rod protein FlgF